MLPQPEQTESKRGFWSTLSQWNTRLLTYTGIINPEKEELRKYLGDKVDNDLEFVFSKFASCKYSKKIFPFAYHHEFTFLQKLVLLTMKYPAINNYLRETTKLTNMLEEKCGLFYFKEEGLGTQLTALHLACMYVGILVTEETVGILIDAGSNIDAVDNRGRSALYMATIYSNGGMGNKICPNVVKTLLGAGINTDLVDAIGITILHHLIVSARTEEHMITFNMIMETKPNLNIRDINGWTPLHIIAMCANCKEYSVEPNRIISYIKEINFLNSKFLDTKKIFTMQKQETIDYYFDSIAILDVLLKGGASRNITDAHGLTPLHYAATHAGSTSNITVVQILLSEGANVLAKSKLGYTPLHCAAMYANNLSSEETVAILAELLSKDNVSNIDATDLDGNTALIYAAVYSHTTSTFNTVKILVDNGANVNIINKFGKTLLQLAYESKFNNIETVKFLIDRGATLPQGNSLISMLNYGNMARKKKILEVAIEKGEINFLTKTIYNSFESSVQKIINDITEIVMIDRMKEGDCFLCLDECLVIKCKYNHGICGECLQRSDGKYRFCEVCGFLFIC